MPIGVKDELLIGKTGDGARIARERLLLEVVALGQGHKIRGDVLLDTFGNFGDGAFGEVEVGNGLDVPVEYFAAVASPFRPDGALREIRPFLNLAVAGDVDVHDVFEPPPLHRLAAEDSEIAGARVGLCGLFESDDLRALFGGRSCGRDAGDSETDNDDISRNLFLNLVSSDLGRYVRPRIPPALPGSGKTFLGGGACSLRRAAAQSCNAGNGRGGYDTPFEKASS